MRTTLIRDPYRALVNAGKTYAAFSPRELNVLKDLRCQRILDPMSGYGLVARHCASRGVDSFCLEFNPPQYLWQILMLPTYASNFVQCISSLLRRSSDWPSARSAMTVSDDWFPQESLRIIRSLYGLCLEVVDSSFGPQPNRRTIALALLLPFAGRFCCCVPGDISTHTKKGGMCVYKDWRNDFRLYLKILNDRRLAYKPQPHFGGIQTSVLGDARTYKFPLAHFDGLMTSPPYPNHRDFSSMFVPERVLLDHLAEERLLDFNIPDSRIIGTNFVSERQVTRPKAKAARHFLKLIAGLPRSKNAIYDDTIYYIPYFEIYFSDLEQAYRNVLPSLMDHFEGYVIVVNNTHRGLVVPVSDVVVEIWRTLGCRAEIYESTEFFHVGTKNPRARGLRARHTTYIIRIWR